MKILEWQLLKKCGVWWKSQPLIVRKIELFIGLIIFTIVMFIDTGAGIAYTPVVFYLIIFIFILACVFLILYGIWKLAERLIEEFNL